MIHNGINSLSQSVRPSSEMMYDYSERETKKHLRVYPTDGRTRTDGLSSALVERASERTQWREKGQQEGGKCAKKSLFIVVLMTPAKDPF